MTADENNRFLDTHVAGLEAEVLELRDIEELTGPAIHPR